MSSTIHRTGFVSEIDQFLRGFDEKRKHLPPSRKAEIEKHRDIARRRDHATAPDTDAFWAKGS